MSLSTFLLEKHQSKGVGSIDGDLDSLFRSSVRLLQTLALSVVNLRAGISSSDESYYYFRSSERVKRKKSAKAIDQSLLTSKPENAGPVKNDSKKIKRKRQISEASTSKSKTKDVPEGSDEEEADGGLEKAYERRNRHLAKEGAPSTSKNKEGPEDTSDSEVDASQLVHETVAKGDRHAKTRPTRRRIHHDSPPNETKEQRDARTIFIGNVPVDVAKSKAALKQFRRHILLHVPGSKIESMRFRSVAFQKPTSAAPAPRTHSLERTAEWRGSRGDDVPAAPPQLTSHDKKKIAFIRHELHEEADTVAVYVLFAHGEELAPDEAARTAIVVLDNSPFMGHTLRADTLGDGVGDPKCTVFVGSLDFASHEEDLRTFFEGVVSAERGPPSAVPDSGSDDEAGAEAKPKTWVTRVRIVRDKDTLLGKGIAYVQFADRECVDEILALEPGKLKFAKRKLRVERCKTLPGILGRPSSGVTTATTSTTLPSRGTHSQSSRPTPTAVPKGNPNLGMQLAHLSKTERKAAKAVDPERVARRLAKKKARNALQVPEQGKDRVRVRKNTTEHKGIGAPARRKKSRVRSERSVEKRNTKK
ncbi:hypothetical protein EDB89DRAFT_2202330 [Lactarius sanguifluus]|nr:hypothetical protein EDB89DRAFT_2202330 [Lactarius sanguifluus]